MTNPSHWNGPSGVWWSGGAGGCCGKRKLTVDSPVRKENVTAQGRRDGLVIRGWCRPRRDTRQSCVLGSLNEFAVVNVAPWCIYKCGERM